jgi:competence ComEA-like helix-hairpin-helix protein
MKNLITLVILAVLSISFSQPVHAKKHNSNKMSVTKVSKIDATTVNLNKADAKQIALVLKGIGINKAKSIIAYRQKHGSFKAIEELASVKGIGVATVAKNYKRSTLK